MPSNIDENFEVAVEEETTAGAPTEDDEGFQQDRHKEKEKQDTVSSGKQRKIRSMSIDDGDRSSFSSNRQALIDGSRKERKSNADSDSASIVNPVVTQPVFPPPWPEWSDDFINEESWDVDFRIDYFEDAFAATDFLNLKAYHLMRPTEFLREPPIVVKFSSPVIDLITPNAHLCEKSEILRYILSEISELYDYSIQNKFVECEGEGLAYVSNYAEDDRRWTPWSHIYSCCKAGVRGEKPVYNPKGKYYVRLYFLGAWRRILVDDRIPVLPSGQSGLPLTSLNELWPLLLTKALLKVATVTWKDDNVKNFSAISALTGWVFEWIDNIDGVNENELWADLQNTLPKYMDPKRIPSCYTLLHPSRKTRKFGDIEESDTFWWMPNYVIQAIEEEDFVLKDEAEDEPFEVDPRDVISTPTKPIVETNEFGEEVIKHAFFEVKWRRKTVQEPPPDLHHGSKSTVGTTGHILGPNEAHGAHDHTGDVEVGGDDKNNELSHVADGIAVAKKKKKKGGIGAALEDNKSERKSIGKIKHLKKPKDGDNKSKMDFKKKAKNANVANDGNEPQDTTDAAEDDQDDGKSTTGMGKKSVKMKGLKHWEKLKNILMGDSEHELPARMSRSLRKSVAERMEEGAHRRRSKHPIKRGKGEGEEDFSLAFIDDADESAKVKKPMLPSVAEILYGVQKYAGIDYRNIVKNWENICGKDSPISLMVVLKNFPTPEEDTMGTTVPFVPGFLQHPIQLTEVRDTVLQKQTGRPETPLWKRFRWKKWAMKKGLIPMEVDRSKEVIRAVKAKTPFVFKNDWYDFVNDNVEYEEEDGEFAGEDDDDDDWFGDVAVSTFFFSLRKSTVKENAGKKKHSDTQERHRQVPPTPPPTKQSPPQQGRQSRGNSLGANMTLQSTGKPSRVGSGPAMLASDALVPSAPDKRNTRRSEDAFNIPKKSLVSANLESTTSAGGPDGIKIDIEGSNSDIIVLHEAEIVHGESDEDFDENFKRKMLKSQENVAPSAACVSLWFNSDDIARNLRKFCKFYTSQSIFGTCYILRREPTIPLKLDSLFYEIHSDLPKYPDFLTEYKQKHECLNIGMEFDRWKNYHVSDYHLDNREGIDSAFYLFSDCWTEQELIFTVHVLQDECLKKYHHVTESSLNEEMPGPPPSPMSRGMSFVPSTPPQTKSEDLPLTLVIETWDWRQDVGLTQPLLLCTSISDRWISHINLPAGRNTFRVWLFYQDTNLSETNLGSKRSTPSSGEESSGQSDFLKRKNMVPFSIRIVSQTPIYVGSRSEVFNYMTNPPMLFLKQCERLAKNLWGLFACFGKQRSAYYQNLRQLRRSYCPTYSQPNMINKLVRGSHDSFEELFVSLVTLFNEGKLDRMLILTLRVLFLNPMIGRKLAPRSLHRTSGDGRMFHGVFKGLGKKAKWMLINATMTIQKYYRGWRVRRLFQLRKRSHPDFKKIEYNVRRIAYLLAKETDSVFSQKDPTTGEYVTSTDFVSVADLSVDPEKVPPTILPAPPHWAVDLLRYLSERHPWLITLYPHANCVSHQVKIQELDGELPQRVKYFSWYPFFRESLKVPSGVKSCFVELDLQVYPPLGIQMKVINNDNGKFLKTVSNRLFIGRLFANKCGYTVLCFRWAIPTLKQELNDRPHSNIWKLRLITPHDQEGPVFQSRMDFLSQALSGEDVNANINAGVEDRNYLEGDGSGEKRNSVISSTNEESTYFPSKLSLRRVTGYYTPNKDYSVCQYIFETDEKRTSISLRFLASNPKAHLRVLIWNCAKKGLVFDEACEGGLIAPCIQLHLLRPKPESPEKRLSHEERSSEGLCSPLSDELEATNSDLLDKMMNKNSNSKTSSKLSVEGEEHESEEKKGSRKNSATSSTKEQKRKRSSLKSNDSNKPVPEKTPVVNKRRYIISVYVTDETWPLSDRELLYVLYRERKFFRSVKAHHCKDLKQQREDAIKKAEEAAQQAAAEAAAAAAAENQQAIAESEQQLIGAAGIEIKVTTPPPDAGQPSTVGVERPSEPKKDFKELQSVKRKTKKKDTDKSGTAEGGNTAPSSASVAPTPQPEDTPVVPPTYPMTPPPSTISATALGSLEDKTGQNANDANSKKQQGKIKRRINGSLYVKYGGHQSQNVKHLDQPHWILEIVTDSRVKYKLKSNWQILRKRFLQAKESWESGGVELLYQDLSSRLDYLLENMVEENYNNVKQHKFSIIDPIVHLYSCLRMDEYDMMTFTTHDFIRLLIQAWSADPGESKQAGEKFLQNRKGKLPLLNEQEELRPRPEQVLDYIPKNLRKLAETFLRRIEERELERERERELQLQMELKFQNPSDEDEDEEEEDEEEEAEVVPTLFRKSTAAISERPESTHQTDGDTVQDSRLGVSGASKKIPSDAKTEKSVMKKGKKPIISKSQNDVTPIKHGTKKVKNDKERSSFQKGKDGKPLGADQSGGKRTSRTESAGKRKSAGTAENNMEEEFKEDWETELARIKQCSHVEDIIKKYNGFFKEARYIREELVEMIQAKTKQKVTDIPKKILLTKTGVSSYAEKSDGEGGHKEGEKETMESVVANKLLRWGFDSSSLPPTEEYHDRIEDPRELPMFLVRTIMEELRLKEQLEMELAEALASAEAEENDE